MSALSTLLAADIPLTSYLGIFSEDPPHVQDPLTVEIIGLAYNRPEAVFTLSGAVFSSSQLFAFYGLLPNTYVAALGIFDTPTNGNLLLSVRLTPVHLIKGGTLTIDGLTLTVPS